MIVSSTEFQQRVGHYLALAQKGEEIIVEKRKPGLSYFVVTCRDMEVDPKRMKERQKKLRRFAVCPRPLICPINILSMPS